MNITRETASDPLLQLPDALTLITLLVSHHPSRHTVIVNYSSFNLLFIPHLKYFPDRNELASPLFFIHVVHKQISCRLLVSLWLDTIKQNLGITSEVDCSVIFEDKDLTMNK